MTAPSQSSVRVRPHLMLALICGLAVLNFVDRLLLAAATPLIKQEFALSDTAVGALSATFALVYAVGGIPVGRLADMFPRRWLVGAAATVWSLMTAACGMAPTYTALIAARMGVAFCESGFTPAVYSLMSDLFPPARRNFVFGLFIASCSIGVVLGLALGGVLAAQYGWRTAFIGVGLTGLVLVAITTLLMREPPRATHDAATEEHAATFTFLAGIKRLWSDKVFLWSVLTAGFNGYATGIVQWLPSFFARTHELPLGMIGLLFGTAYGLGMAFGQVFGGWLAERMARHGIFRPLKLCILSNAFLPFGFAAVLLVPNANLAIALTMITALVGCLNSPVLTGAIQNVAPNRLRGVAHAWLTLSLSVFGLGLGPIGVGLLSDHLTPAMGEARALQTALLASLSLFFVGTLTSWLAWRAGRRADARILETQA